MSCAANGIHCEGLLTCILLFAKTFHLTLIMIIHFLGGTPCRSGNRQIQIERYLIKLVWTLKKYQYMEDKKG